MPVLTIADVRPDILADLSARYKAHQHTYTNVGRTGENKFTGSCSCGTWAVTVPVRRGELWASFDAHLTRDVYPDYAQARCFCGRGVFASPVPGVWVHLDYMGEFYGHQGRVLAS